jgi:hypothetical protein
MCGQEPRRRSLGWRRQRGTTSLCGPTRGVFPAPTAIGSTRKFPTSNRRHQNRRRLLRHHRHPRRRHHRHRLRRHHRHRLRRHHRHRLRRHHRHRLRRRHRHHHRHHRRSQRRSRHQGVQVRFVRLLRGRVTPAPCGCRGVQCPIRWEERSWATTCIGAQTAPVRAGSKSPMSRREPPRRSPVWPQERSTTLQFGPIRRPL